MKDVHLSLMTLVVIAVGIVSCSKENNVQPSTNNETSELIVEEKQNAFLGYVGATWCAPCGSYGGPGFKYMKNQYVNNEVVSLYCAISGATTPVLMEGGREIFSPFIKEFYGAMKDKGSIPFFNINGNNEGGPLTTVEGTSQKFRDKLRESIDNPTTIAGIAAQKNLTANELSCKVKIKIFDDYFGELYYCVLALEKEVVGEQEVVGSIGLTDYKHINVTRASLIGDGTMKGQEAFELFAMGDLTIGDEFSKTFSLRYEDIDTGNGFIDWDYIPENTEIIAMVWGKSQTNVGWQYINGVIAQ